jgi:hypothetical protein
MPNLASADQSGGKVLAQRIRDRLERSDETKARNSFGVGGKDSVPETW